MSKGEMITENVTFAGGGNDEVNGYYARPSGDGPFPGVIVLQHIHGVDEWIMEVCRRFAHNGYAALAPNLYSRIGSLGHGRGDELAARLQALGGLDDSLAVEDIRGALNRLRSDPASSGRVGAIGFCMGGRFAYLAACKVPELSAAVDCWGGSVAAEAASADMPPVVSFTPEMNVPLLGIFGNDDRRPDPAEVNRTEEALKQHGKDYEFHRYDGAGHAFFNTFGVAHRPEQAQDAWGKVFAFFEKRL